MKRTVWMDLLCLNCLLLRSIYLNPSCLYENKPKIQNLLGHYSPNLTPKGMSTWIHAFLNLRCLSLFCYSTSRMGKGRTSLLYLETFQSGKIVPSLLHLHSLVYYGLYRNIYSCLSASGKEAYLRNLKYSWQAPAVPVIRLRSWYPSSFGLSFGQF